MSEIVTDEEVDKSLDYLRDNAVPAAKAIAEAGYMDDFTRVLKARLMGLCNEPTSAAQERYAYAHADMESHLVSKRTAIAKAEEEKFLLKAASYKIDVWKSEQFRNRTMEKIQ
jgi:hypothetical protein